MKRRFVVVAASLEELASQAPIAARCVSTALMISHGLRRGTDLVLAVLNGPSIHFITSKLRSVAPDEASLLGVLRKALRACLELGRLPRTVHSGVAVNLHTIEHYTAGFPLKFLCSASGVEPRSVFLRAREPAVFLVPLSGSFSDGRRWGAVELKFPIDRLWPDQVISLINITLDRWSGCGDL